MHLSSAELAPTAEIGAVERGDRVDDEEREAGSHQQASLARSNSPRLCHHASRLNQE